jgi:glycosyltransferase involved in cell wall biosynthesis
MKQHDIIITGIQPWDIEIGSNCKNIAEELSRNHRVLYINSPLDRISSIQKRTESKVQKRLDVINGKVSPIEIIHNNLWVYTPPVIIESMNWLPLNLFRIVNKINNKRFAKTILSAIKELEFKNYILFTDSDMFRSNHLSQLLNPEKFIYYTRDNLMTVPYWEKHGKIMEPEILKAADMVVANSPHLAKLSGKHNKHSYYVGQGCDTDLYRNIEADIPPEIKKMDGLIIGYTGLLTSRRLDIGVIEKIATEKPNWNIVLVGPEETCFKNSSLHALKNVHFLGAKPPSILPAYVNAFDVCINPQIVNELTKGNYPRKIDEYLAAGKITVATYTPTMEVFKGFCYLAKTANDYINLINKGLEENNKDRIQGRKNFTASHSWANSVNAIWQSLNLI